MAYGDGVFETMLAINGKIPFWVQHQTRLFKGIKDLGLNISLSVFESMSESLFKRLNTLSSPCVVKLMVTRGVSNRGYIPTDSPANISIMLTELPANPFTQSGCSVHQCNEVLPTPLSWAGLKTLNQLSYVLASQERRDTPFNEGLLLSNQGYIIEATARNLFFICDNVLHTPDLSLCGVAGVMREKIIDTFAPALGLKIDIGLKTNLDLCSADEVFLCNSVTGIWPVTHYNVNDDDHSWPIGKLTLKLQTQLQDFIEAA